MLVEVLCIASGDERTSIASVRESCARMHYSATKRQQLPCSAVTSPPGLTVACKCGQNFCAHTSYNGWTARETDWREARDGDDDLMPSPPSLPASGPMVHANANSRLGLEQNPENCSAADCSTQEIHRAPQATVESQLLSFGSFVETQIDQGTRARTLELFVPDYAEILELGSWFVDMHCRAGSAWLCSSCYPKVCHRHSPEPEGLK